MIDKNFITRSISSIFIILINLIFIYSENIIFDFMFIFILGIFMAYEWSTITNNSNNKKKLAILGIFYIIFTLFPILFLKLFPSGSNLLMFLFVIIWSMDTFAYMVGAKLKLNKHKITKISPNKSYEGLIGGIIGAMIFGYIFTSRFLPQFKNILLYFIPILCCFEQASDITESYLKRKFNVKDSGDFIPGHGGFLDRYDGFLYTTIMFLFIIITFLA